MSLSQKGYVSPFLSVFVACSCKNSHQGSSGLHGAGPLKPPARGSNIVLVLLKNLSWWYIDISILVPQVICHKFLPWVVYGFGSVPDGAGTQDISASVYKWKGPYAVVFHACKQEVGPGGSQVQGWH